MAINYFAPLMLDDYKLNHPFQYPQDTEEVYANQTARSGKLSNIPNSKGVINFGLQMFIIDYLIEDWNIHFFLEDKDYVLRKYSQESGMPLAKLGHISALHDLGYIPLEIKALPEGSFVPYGIPLSTTRNTEKEFAWMTNSIESVMSAETWPMINTITTTAEYLRVFHKYAERTGADINVIPYQPHNFSFRGMMFRESSVKVGVAHLAAGVNGTDTTYASALATEFYAAPEKIGCSIPATEHSVMCAGGKDDEIQTIKRLLTEIYPSGDVSVVMDTWDFFKAVAEGLPTIKDIIINRDGKLVVRPDSGDPVKIICGDPLSSDLYASKGLIQLLSEIFGYTLNSKGFKVLNPHIGAIYGDSITLQRQEEILAKLEQKGFSSENIFLGVGSYSFQYTTRDTHGIAIKSTAVTRSRVHIPIFKDPITDSGTKKSARGYLMVSNGIRGYTLEQNVNPKQERQGCLETVFKNGKLVKFQNIHEIRARVKKEYILA